MGPFGVLMVTSPVLGSCSVVCPEASFVYTKGNTFWDSVGHEGLRQQRGVGHVAFDGKPGPWRARIADTAEEGLGLGQLVAFGVGIGNGVGHAVGENAIGHDEVGVLGYGSATHELPVGSDVGVQVRLGAGDVLAIAVLVGPHVVQRGQAHTLGVVLGCSRAPQG